VLVVQNNYLTADKRCFSSFGGGCNTKEDITVLPSHYLGHDRTIILDKQDVTVWAVSGILRTQG
jgi:hypothetical protein